LPLLKFQPSYIEFGYPILSSEWTKQYSQQRYGFYRSVITSLLPQLSADEWRGANKLNVDCKRML